MDDTEEIWRVGDLARATGLTVRTLHYYGGRRHRSAIGPLCVEADVKDGG